MPRSAMKLVGVLLVGAVMAVTASPLAAAHVGAYLDGGGAGETGLITLRVPGESDKPPTTKVEVRIPDDIQIRTVRVQPIAGWNIDITKKKTNPTIFRDDGTAVNEVVSSVTWTATGPGIMPGQFDDFVLEAGPLPDAEALTLPTFQTFADGSTDAWTDTAPEETDPEYPAPSVSLAVGPATPLDGGNGVSGLTSVIAWTALGFAVIAVALGLFAIDRARRSAESASLGVATATPAGSEITE